MPVISAAGKIMNPLVVLACVEGRYRKRSNGQYETPADFLLLPNYFFMPSTAGVDTDILFSSAAGCVRQTEQLRSAGEK